MAVGVMRLDEESYCLKVSLTTPPAADVSLPKHIEGVPVKVEVVGRIHKRS